MHRSVNFQTMFLTELNIVKCRRNSHSLITDGGRLSSTKKATIEGL